MADRIVPLLAGRPLSVKRVRPGQPPFMQRNVSKGAPDWVRTVPVWSEGSNREIQQVLCDDRRTLLWLANQRVVEFHVPFLPRRGSRSPPAWSSTWTRRRGPTSGSSCRRRGWSGRRCEESGLSGAVKTSGSKGVHVVVPVQGLAVRGRRRRDPCARRPHRAPRPGARHDGIHQGGPARAGLRRLDPVGPGDDRRRLQPADPAGVPVSVPVGWDALDDVRPERIHRDVGGGPVPDRVGAELPEPQTLPADLVAEGRAIPIARVQAMHEGKRRKRAQQAADGDADRG